LLPRAGIFKSLAACACTSQRINYSNLFTKK
jgi:hypothetical protein